MNKANVEFTTLINGTKYTFRGYKGDWLWVYEALLNDRYVTDVRGRNEESVILDLVKQLEK